MAGAEGGRGDVCFPSATGGLQHHPTTALGLGGESSSSTLMELTPPGSRRATARLSGGGSPEVDMRASGTEASPSPQGPPGPGSEANSPTLESSASESGALVTKREFQRVKRRLTHVSEHLREKLLLTKQALEQETQERQEESPLLKKLVDQRMETLSAALHAGLQDLRTRLAQS